MSTRDREQKLRALHPDEPWMWREGWVNRRMVYSNRSRSVGLLVIAVLFISAGSGVAYVFIQNQTSPLRWLMLLIPGFGVLLLYGGVRLAILGFRHPQLTLVLDKLPLRPGHRFTAGVEVATLPEGQVRTTLSCIGRAHTEQEEELWSDGHVIRRSLVEGTPLIIPIDFNLPYGAQQTSESSDIIWKLSVEIGGEKGSPDVGGHFELPVFETKR